MAKRTHSDLNINQLNTSLVVFMGSYNVTIPKNFPQATIPALERFKEIHPTLFKGPDTWSMDKHRKRFMDWMPSYLSSK